MTISRRKFLQSSAFAGAGILAARNLAWASGQSPRNIKKFAVRLPSLGTSPLPPNEDGLYIPVAIPDRTRFPGVDYYRIQIDDFRQQLHHDLPGPARFIGFSDITDGRAPDPKYLGGVIIVKSGTPVQVTFVNRMPSDHPLPVDPTIPGGAGPGFGAPNRSAVHLHGGFVPWVSDGGPYDWWGPDGRHGLSFLNNVVIPGASNGVGEAEYYYPNAQSARLLWYHDHAVGLTRLNAYAGIASAYLIFDDVEELLIKQRILPSLPGLLRYGIPLIIQDKTFYDARLDNGPGYPGDTAPGSLFYPYQYDADRPPDGTPTLPLPSISCVAEFFSDTAMVNGAPYPYLPVEQRHYRFRILNACQGRFLNLQLYYASPDGMEADLNKPGPRMIQIANEGGFLPAPVALNDPPVQFFAQYTPDGDYIPGTLQYNLLMAPAERSDVVIDFSNVPVGSRLILYTDAPAPFPTGDPGNDYFTGANIGATPYKTVRSKGPNTRTLMQFRVVARTSAADPASLNILEAAALTGQGNPLPPVETLTGVKERWLTLNETFDDYGRLIQRLGTVDSKSIDILGEPTWGLPLEATPTELVTQDDTEIWRIVNLTGDTHPMHFHLVNVQVLERRTFDVENYNGGIPTFTGPARAQDPNERGYKETIRMNPGEVTSIIMHFAMPQVPFQVPASPRIAQYTGADGQPIQGAEYVWHCHILEHEEHDMMRPIVVLPK